MMWMSGVWFFLWIICLMSILRWVFVWCCFLIRWLLVIMFVCIMWMWYCCVWLVFVLVVVLVNKVELFYEKGCVMCGFFCVWVLVICLDLWLVFCLVVYLYVFIYRWLVRIDRVGIVVWFVLFCDVLRLGVWVFFW